jgi:hypothetical protein
LGLDRRTQVPAFVAEHETGRPEEEHFSHRVGNPEQVAVGPRLLAH